MTMHLVGTNAYKYSENIMIWMKCHQRTKIILNCLKKESIIATIYLCFLSSQIKHYIICIYIQAFFFYELQ